MKRPSLFFFSSFPLGSSRAFRLSKTLLLSISFLLFASCSLFETQKAPSQNFRSKNQISVYHAEGRVARQGKENYTGSFSMDWKKDFFFFKVSKIFQGPIYEIQITPDQILVRDFLNSSENTYPNTPENRKSQTGFDWNFEILRAIFLGMVPEQENLEFTGIRDRPETMKIHGEFGSNEIIFEEWKKNSGLEIPVKIRVQIAENETLTFLILQSTLHSENPVS